MRTNNLIIVMFFLDILVLFFVAKILLPFILLDLYIFPSKYEKGEYFYFFISKIYFIELKIIVKLYTKIQ